MGRRLIDISGQTFGRLTVLARAQDKATGAGGAIWLCRCQCGVEKVIAGGMLRAGNTFSCGCLRATSIDLTGRRFYRLVALRPHAERKHHWHCLCDCGKAVIIATGNLTGGSTKSCGCYKLDFNCAKALDLSDRRFGKLIALRQVSKPLGGPFRWVCRCDCGTEKILIASDLTGGRVISCGCMANKRIALRPVKVRARNNANTHRRKALKAGNGGSFTAAEIEALFLKQKGKCANCRTKITRETMHRDHVVPLARGGSSLIGNIQLLCQPCNARKGAKHPIDFALENGRLV